MLLFCSCFAPALWHSWSTSTPATAGTDEHQRGHPVTLSPFRHEEHQQRGRMISAPMSNKGTAPHRPPLATGRTPFRISAPLRAWSLSLSRSGRNWHRFAPLQLISGHPWPRFAPPPAYITGSRGLGVDFRGE